jgi:hypothetical protein
MGVHVTPAEYRAKAEEFLAQAKLAEPKANYELVALALRYLRLADLAGKNAGTDVVYETPTVTVPMQQQPQVEQQQQQAAKPDSSDEK